MEVEKYKENSDQSQSSLFSKPQQDYNDLRTQHEEIKQEIKKPQKINSKQVEVNKTSVLNQAKLYLKEIKYDFEQFHQWEGYHKLNKEDLKKINYFKYNQNKKVKKDQTTINQEPTQERKPQKTQMAALMARFENELKETQQCLSLGQKTTFLKSKLEQFGMFEFSVFLKFLHTSGIKTDIFECLMEIVNGESQGSLQKDLLIQACLFYNGQKVQLNQEAIRQVISDFKFMEEELQHCFGFLQILYENNSAAFSQIQLSQIIELEREMPSLQILLSIFLKQYMNPTLKEFFPSTLLCLTPPIISDIKTNGGKTLVFNVPYEWIEDYVALLVYSFESSQDNFSLFITSMQKNFLQYHRNLKHYQFQRAVKYVADSLFKKELNWIGNLLKVLQFFKVIKEDVIVKKETIITQNIIITIIKNDAEDIQRIPNNRFIKQSEDNEQFYILECEQLNYQNEQFLNFIDSYHGKKFSQELTKLITLSQIDILHPVYKICLEYLINCDGLCFSVVGIGNGKTLLCNILAAKFSKFQNEQVIVLNKVKNLSQRNAIFFEQTFGNALNIIVDFDGKVKDFKPDVIFLCDDELQKYLKEKNQQISDFIVIVDEADQILFSEEVRILNQHELKKWKNKINYFCQSKKLYAFTGSLSKEENDVIQKYLTPNLVIYPQINKFKDQQLIRLTNKEYQNKDIWLLNLTKEILDRCHLHPILILTTLLYEKQLIKHIKQDNSNGVQVLSLIDKNPFEINSALEQASKTNLQSNYPIFLVDETLGRDLDIKTNSQIEENGGLYVIIAKVPSSTKVYNQVKWRTQRMMNRGQYSIIAYNPTEKSYDQLLNEGDAKIKLNLIKMVQLFKNSCIKDFSIENPKDEAIQNIHQQDQKQLSLNQENEEIKGGFEIMKDDDMQNVQTNIISSSKQNQDQQKTLEDYEQEFLERYYEKQNNKTQYPEIPNENQRLVQTRQLRKRQKNNLNWTIQKKDIQNKQNLGKKRTYNINKKKLIEEDKFQDALEEFQENPSKRVKMATIDEDCYENVSQERIECQKNLEISNPLFSQKSC